MLAVWDWISIFLIAILHRDLRNDFFFLFLQTIYFFQFLFGLFFPFSIWTFIPFSIWTFISFLDFYFFFWTFFFLDLFLFWTFTFCTNRDLMLDFFQVFFISWAKFWQKLIMKSYTWLYLTIWNVKQSVHFFAELMFNVLGSSPIWTCRILNICFDFFPLCLPAEKYKIYSIFKIRNVQIDELPRTQVTKNYIFFVIG